MNLIETLLMNYQNEMIAISGVLLFISVPASLMYLSWNDIDPADWFRKKKPKFNTSLFL